MCHFDSFFFILYLLLTVYYRRVVQKYGDKNCMGSRVTDPKTGKTGPYVFKKYKEVYTAAKEVAAGLRKMGVNAVRATRKFFVVLKINFFPSV